MLVSFANFVVIQYRLLIEAIPSLKAIFSNMAIFIITFIAAYMPAAVLIGWWDYRRGAVPTESALVAKASPYVRDMLITQQLSMQALMLYMKNKHEKADEKIQEALKILEKWSESR